MIRIFRRRLSHCRMKRLDNNFLCCHVPAHNQEQKREAFHSKNLYNTFVTMLHSSQAEQDSASNT